MQKIHIKLTFMILAIFGLNSIFAQSIQWQKIGGQSHEVAPYQYRIEGGQLYNGTKVLNTGLTSNVGIAGFNLNANTASCENYFVLEPGGKIYLSDGKGNKDLISVDKGGKSVEAVDIATDPTKMLDAYIVRTDGKIAQLANAKYLSQAAGYKIGAKPQGPVYWEIIPNQGKIVAKRITINHDHHLWVVDVYGQVHEYNPANKKWLAHKAYAQDITFGESSHPGEVLIVAVDPSQVKASGSFKPANVSPAYMIPGKLQRKKGTTWVTLDKGKWAKVAFGAFGKVVVINTQGEVFLGKLP